MLSLYVLVFGIIFGGKLNEAAETETKIEYALGIFLGLAIHHFVAEVLTISPTAIITNPNFVKKVVFPTSVLPVTTVAGALVHFVISLILIFFGMLIFGLEIQWALLIWLPVILMPLVITAVGISLGLAAVTIFWRDILQITPFLSLALLFASAVFYPVAQIPERAWVFLKFNPPHSLDRRISKSGVLGRVTADQPPILSLWRGWDLAAAWISDFRASSQSLC